MGPCCNRLTNRLPCNDSYAPRFQRTNGKLRRYAKCAFFRPQCGCAAAVEPPIEQRADKPQLIPTPWGGTLQLTNIELKLGATRLRLVAPVDVDAVMDMYIDAGKNDRDPYWARPWPCGIALAGHLLENPGIVQGLNVCDLGAGLGVAGLGAALAGASQVALLDREPMALHCAAVSAALTGLQPRTPDGSPLDVAALTAHEKDASLTAFRWLPAESPAVATSTGAGPSRNHDTHSIEDMPAGSLQGFDVVAANMPTAAQTHSCRDSAPQPPLPEHTASPDPKGAHMQVQSPSVTGTTTCERSTEMLASGCMEMLASSCTEMLASSSTETRASSSTEISSTEMLASSSTETRASSSTEMLASSSTATADHLQGHRGQEAVQAAASPATSSRPSSLRGGLAGTDAYSRNGTPCCGSSRNVHEALAQVLPTSRQTFESPGFQSIVTPQTAEHPADPAAHQHNTSAVARRPTTQSNAAGMRPEARSQCSLLLQEFDWSLPMQLPANVVMADVVLACDVLYESFSVSPIVALLPKLLRDGGRLLLADPPSRTPHNRKEFLAALQVHWGEVVVESIHQRGCCASVAGKEMIAGAAPGEVIPVQVMVLKLSGCRSLVATGSAM